MKKEPENKITAILSNIELFKGFNLTQLNSVVSNSSMHFQSYEANSIIISQGDKYRELFILVKGQCISEITSYNGKIIQISHLRAPFIIAPAALLSKSRTSPVTLKTGGKDHAGIIQFIVIPEKELSYLISTSALFTRNLLSIVSGMVISLSERISFLTLNSIEEKFINYLFSLKNSGTGDIITLPVKLDDLAAYFGVERPSLSRSISELIKKGILNKYRSKGKTSYRIIRFY